MKKEPNLQERNTKELVCIICPRGCLLTAHKENDELAIKGNLCPRGVPYARQELTNPLRDLTALMRPEGAEKPVSVRTDKPVPRSLLRACAAEIYRTHPKTPIRRGDVLIEDLCGTGSRVIATRDSV